MSTLRQKKLAKKIIENASSSTKMTAGEMLENVGYTTSVAKHKPSEIIESVGVQKELVKYGFNEDSAKNLVVNLMNKEYAEDAVRLNAAKEVFKVFGTYAAEKTFNLTATASVDELKSIIQQDLAKFRPND